MAIHEASVPISPAPQCIPHGQLARSLGTFGPICPKARGLRPQSSSSCTWLSHAPTTMALPTLRCGLGVSLALVASRLVIIRHVSPIPPLEPCVRLLSHTAHEIGNLW